MADDTLKRLLRRPAGLPLANSTGLTAEPKLAYKGGSCPLIAPRAQVSHGAKTMAPGAWWRTCAAAAAAPHHTAAPPHRHTAAPPDRRAAAASPRRCPAAHRYGKHLPLIQSVAIRVLSQTVCASAAERNWSVYGQVKIKERSRMGHEMGDMRVYCHEALHLQEKMQTSGYKAKVEKWDSDSDSDETDEEDLRRSERVVV
jgi:hypothetical protein